jgi:ribose-phosphate pyrophosphokinase
MVRNIVILGGSSHPQLVNVMCGHLGVPPANVLLGKFSCGETRVEIKESVRGKDVYIIQSGGGKVNDNFMELLVTISACKTASARKVTAVLPIFPYSRQRDIPYNKTGAPLSKASTWFNRTEFSESNPQAPSMQYHEPNQSVGPSSGVDGLHRSLSKSQLDDSAFATTNSQTGRYSDLVNGKRGRSDTTDSGKSVTSDRHWSTSSPAISNGVASEVNTNSSRHSVFSPQPGYKQWVAQAGTLVADLLTCAGADHIITMDLHDPQYQGFFDIPVDNLYGRSLLKNYIQYRIPDYLKAVIVSPDAGGAKRATAIADHLGMSFALIHKVFSTLLGVGGLLA